jgi:hypothetical protein
MIGLELAFQVPFRKVSIAREERILREGAPVRHSRGGGEDVIWAPVRLRGLYPSPREPGKYAVEVRQRYSVNVDHEEKTWSWRPWSGPFPRCLLPRRDTARMRFRSLERWDYACSIAVQTEIVVVEALEAEKIDLRCSAELDGVMGAAFRSNALAIHGGYSTASGQRYYNGGLEIRFRDLPEAVGFTPALRLGDGREFPAARRGVSQRMYERAGGTRGFTITPMTFMLEVPGSYAGSVVLRSDAKVAYEDPAIKAIWDGELEFPVSFEVYSTEPNTP